MNLDLHFSSKSSEWETPQTLFDELNAQFGPFNLDVAAHRINAKCDHYFTEQMDGLKQKWAGKCWMNPPYGRHIQRWVKKAYDESHKGCLVVALLPARTDTKWFHDYCLKGKIKFLRGRLKFGEAKNSAPFPSMIVVFDGTSN